MFQRLPLFSCCLKPVTGHHAKLKHLLACFPPLEQRQPPQNFLTTNTHMSTHSLGHTRTTQSMWDMHGHRTAQAGGYLSYFDPWPACSAVVATGPDSEPSIKVKEEVVRLGLTYQPKQWGPQTLKLRNPETEWNMAEGKLASISRPNVTQAKMCNFKVKNARTAIVKYFLSKVCKVIFLRLFTFCITMMVSLHSSWPRTWERERRRQRRRQRSQCSWFTCWWLAGGVAYCVSDFVCSPGLCIKTTCIYTRQLVDLDICLTKSVLD